MSLTSNTNKYNTVYFKNFFYNTIFTCIEVDQSTLEASSEHILKDGEAEDHSKRDNRGLILGDVGNVESKVNKQNLIKLKVKYSDLPVCIPAGEGQNQSKTIGTNNYNYDQN